MSDIFLRFLFYDIFNTLLLKYLHIHLSNFLFVYSERTLTYPLLLYVYYSTDNHWVIWASKTFHILYSFLFDSFCDDKVYLSPFRVGFTHVFIILPNGVSPINLVLYHLVHITDNYKIPVRDPKFVNYLFESLHSFRLLLWSYMSINNQ